MRKKRIILIAGLMVVALLYLITMQYLWLNTRYDNLKSDFERKAIKAVEQANADFQNDYFLTAFDLNMKGEAAEPAFGQKVFENFALMGQMLSKSMSKESSSILTPDYAKIDELIEAELSELNLSSLSYGLTVKRQFDDSLLYTRNLETAAFGESITVAPLEQINSLSADLRVNFGGVRPHLFRQLRGQIIPGLVLTLLTAFCFWYAISLIRQQERISRLKNDFIGNMTHELKTPIATISAALEAIQTFDFSEEKKASYIDIARRENLRLAGQVEKVLQIAAFDKDEVVLRIEELPMHRLIHQCVERISLGLENRDGKISLQLNAESDKLWGDRVHLTNAINNLLDNAMKYSPDTPEIALRTSQKNGQFEIVVSDRGEGIPLEHQERIFEKFYRVETGNVHNVKGFGLGLHYVSRVANLHGGSIKVESKRGEGSTFYLQIATKSNSK